MARKISAYCADETAAAVDALAREYGVPREEVVRQLVRAGLKDVDPERMESAEEERRAGDERAEEA